MRTRQGDVAFDKRVRINDEIKQGKRSEEIIDKNSIQDVNLEKSIFEETYMSVDKF